MIEEKVQDLIHNIKILKNNSDYRVSDIIYKRGVPERWKHSGNMVLTNEKYKETILHEYLKINGLYANKNLNLLLTIIEKYNSNYNLPIPQNNEIVIHLRLGDWVFHSNFLSKNYIQLIDNILKNNNNINKITFVTCFSYGVWSKESEHLIPINFKHDHNKQEPTNCTLWEYTEEKQNKNIEKIKILFHDLIQIFPKMEINIYSNLDIDKDMCYCVLSKHLICDVGGFSNLLYILNNLKYIIER